MHLYYTLTMGYDSYCAGWVGGFEIGFSDSMEPTVRYHPVSVVILTSSRDPGEGHS